MRRKECGVAVLLLAVSVVCSAGTYVVPTTTLAAQTSNNTSAASTFWTQSNGNLGAANISKVDVHTLLYANATTKVYAHLLVWFGQSNHMNVGYSSADPAQINRQIEDMISRGIDGVIIDWYGPNTFEDQATQLVKAEAERHPGFTFAIMVDQGAIQWDSCSGCSPQQALIEQLQYVERNYFSSPAYMTQEGRPVVTNFNIDLSYSVDWNAVNAALSSHPIFLFQNNDGFTHTLSGGSYSWVMPATSDDGMSYLTSFYDAGLSVPGEKTVGAAYKGFNDSLATWGSGRIMQQQCGQTWLHTFLEVNGLYNSGRQLPYLQLVTWNDYEEGSEIESGIDDCVALSASVSGQSLQWTVGGDESTIDHYVVYISSDGQNLMTLTQFAPGLHSVNLCSFSIPAGNYKLFVQAVGKPGLANRMPGPVSYSPSCGGGGGGGSTSVAFGASPAAVTISAGKSGSITVTAETQSGSFNNSIALSCAGLSSTLSCSFTPANITPGSGGASSVLTIATVPVTGKNLPRESSLEVYAFALLPFGLAGFVLIGGIPRKRAARAVVLSAILAGCFMNISCGGRTEVQSSAPGGPAPGNYSVTINGNAASVQLSTTVTVTVQ